MAIEPTRAGRSMGFVFGMWLQGGENVERVGEDEDEDELGLPGGRERKGGGEGMRRFVMKRSRFLYLRRESEEEKHALEDKLGIMVGDGKAAFGRLRSADAANREAYEEYSWHYCSGDGGDSGHAGGRSRT